MLGLVLTISLLGLIYYYITKPFKYWTNKGVKQGSPIPIFGDSWRTILKTQSFTEFVQYVYDMFPESPRMKNELKHEDATSNEDAGFAVVQESEVGKATNRQNVLTDLDITAQALIFFFAGFDSVSTLMCFMSHELAVNPDIQKRLRDEVDDIYRDCEGKLTYEALLKMKYMDMVTSETLRKWPSAVAVDRVCTKPYTIEPKTPEETPVHLEVGDVVWLPILSIHRDPKNYPDPERFDPERFSDENKHKINPYAYIPFGSGPRNCIGSRFALLETKAIFFYILSHFEIVPVEKTTIPLKISREHINMTAEGGFWLGLKRRSK